MRWVFISNLKKLTWSFFGVPFNFDTPSQFNTPLGLKGSIGHSSFTSSFIKDALLKDV
jgi:hypothetical protein